MSYRGMTDSQIAYQIATLEQELDWFKGKLASAGKENLALQESRDKARQERDYWRGVVAKAIMPFTAGSVCSLCNKAVVVWEGGFALDHSSDCSYLRARRETQT